MYKSCPICGGIHKTTEDCPIKNKIDYRKNNKIRRFRSGQDWTEKSKDIRDRDNNICQVCYRELYEWCKDKYKYEDVGVHHIMPVRDDWDKRLDDYNLITLCPVCHSKAENGLIDAKVLKEIAEEQEKKRDSERGI